MVLANDRMGQETMMDVAERYLKELAKRCMVQVKRHEDGKQTVTRFKSCRLHDLLRDLCLVKAEEENLYKVIDLRHTGVPSTDSSPAIKRHYGSVLRFPTKDFDKHVFPPKEQTKHLRSFMCEALIGRRPKWLQVANAIKRYAMKSSLFRHSHNRNSWIGRLNNGCRLGIDRLCPCRLGIDRICPYRRLLLQVNYFKMLRVLVVENFFLESRQYDSESILGCIGHLIHLRCLSFRYCRMRRLPSCLGNLKYLETLDLCNTYCSTIPNVLWKLGRLRHLYLPETDDMLPLDGLSKQLEILDSFDNRVSNAKDLSELTNLRALTAEVYESLEDIEQIINHISNLNYIRVTSLQITNCDFGINTSSRKDCMAVLERVLFCKNLHKLKIDGPLCKQLPDFQAHLFSSSSLTELDLCRSYIEKDPMRTLGKFPNLQKLFLHETSFVGKEMICHATEFPQLKVLELYRLDNLEKWKVDEGAMPKLSSLRISECAKLEMIPDGLRSITTLKQLDLRSMHEEFKNRVLVNGAEGPDFAKVCHVPAIYMQQRFSKT